MTANADMLALVNIFDVYNLRSKKARDYALWRKAVLLMIEIPRGHRGIGPADDLTLLAIRDELRVAREFRDTSP